jgi:hypothetical protein
MTLESLAAVSSMDPAMPSFEGPKYRVEHHFLFYLSFDAMRRQVDSIRCATIQSRCR